MALPMAVGFWWFYSGRNSRWVQGRRRGWFCFLYSSGFLFFQGLALAALDPTFEQGRATGPMYGGFILLSLLLPASLMFSFVWAPEFVLPGWIRERRRLGDPVRSVDPPVHIRDQLRHPVYRASDQMRAASAQLPITVGVKRGSWALGGVLGFGAAGFLTSAWFGVPDVFYGDSGVSVRMIQVASVMLIPLSVLAGAYALRGAVRAEPVTISDRGVSTPSWEVAFSEIEQVTVVAPETVGLKVTEEAFSRCVEANRWFSGRPIGMGGLVAKNGWLRLQPGLKEPARHVARLIDDVSGTYTHST